MKFDIKVHYKKARCCKHWLLGVRLTPLAAAFSIYEEGVLPLNCQYLWNRAYDSTPQTFNSNTVSLIMINNFYGFLVKFFVSYKKTVCFTTA